METPVAGGSRVKKLRSPPQLDSWNPKNSIVCENVPDSLLDSATAAQHFSKFGKVQKLKIFSKSHICKIEYDQPVAAERAVLNAGAFDGFMFDVTRFKPKVKRQVKKEEDPDWKPDPEIEQELSAMGATPIYRLARQKAMEVEKPQTPKSVKQTPVRKRVPQTHIVKDQEYATDSPIVTTQSNLSTAEAAAELFMLRAKVSVTPDEQWRILDARDKILRSWGGAGARVKVGGATIGTCPDMCPEKERLHRQAEHQIMNLEAIPDSDGTLDPRRAVKQYSRSSADQEIPMCFELRPADVLTDTCAYLLHEVADTQRQISLPDWFHFLWDRFRGIRKDITQQALCCAESIRLVEMCARFHAHCAARLADLEHTQFDQKLNTDNLTKCLQTLKHMYADVKPEFKPNEAEFRGYIALLNLGDANFWWEIKQLPESIQKSEHITFAIQIFNALDNNNYVRFFRLVKNRATYLQACILLRYFNDVRARALSRIVKAFAPRGGSKYPAFELMKNLSFESVKIMQSFIEHYGLHFGVVHDAEINVILDRNQFFEDSDPFPIGREVNLIESKRNCKVGEVIAGGVLPKYTKKELYTSFNTNGTLRLEALIAEDQGYDTINDTNKDVSSLKSEVLRLINNKGAKPDVFKPKLVPPKDIKTTFSFKPAIPVASNEIISTSPEKIFDSSKNAFAFSKPQVDKSDPFKANVFKNVKTEKPANENVFKTDKHENVFKTETPQNVFKASVFSAPKDATNVFATAKVPAAIFGNAVKENPFASQVKTEPSTNIFAKNNGDNIFAKTAADKPANLFAIKQSQSDSDPKSIFASANPSNVFSKTNVFTQPVEKAGNQFSNGDVDPLTPRTLFKSANQSTDPKGYTIFQSKNATTAESNIFNSIKAEKTDVYDFDQQNNAEVDEQERLRKQQEEEERRREELRLNKERELKLQEMKRLEAMKRQEELRKQQELKRMEEQQKRMEEEKRQAELKKKLEEEKIAEMKRKAEEERRFREQVETESKELIDMLIQKVNQETVEELAREEYDKYQTLMSYADTLTNEIVVELSNEVTYSEMTAEKHLTEKLMKKWFSVWKKQFHRNRKRRSLLDETPVWITQPPMMTAAHLRRVVENAALQNMNAFHDGYKFSGELKQPPPPQPYNIMEIIKSPLLKRMKKLNYPYDKCYFWKLTLLTPGNKYVNRKINVDKWLTDALSDKKQHETESLIHVGKYSWNNLMNFAISVSKSSNNQTQNEAIEGTNGLLFYFVEDEDYIKRIEETLKHRYPYQVLPIAIIMPDSDETVEQCLEAYITNLINSKVISGCKIFVIDSENTAESMYTSTKNALKWLAKNYPPIPPLEIDYLKHICQRYLGNEIWCKLKMYKESRFKCILKDLYKLVDLYNSAVDRLTEVITNEDLFNYPSFPLEFQQYLNHCSPYPKPQEFVPSSVKTSENTSAIKSIMNQLKLPKPQIGLNPSSAIDMQEDMRSYCNQIGWFENPEQVVCKIVTSLPNEVCDETLSQDQFSRIFENYDMLDLLNIVVYEKINSLRNFDNRFAIYERVVLEEYRNGVWWHETNVVSKIKHKAVDYDDDVDLNYFVEAKRPKLDNSLVIEEKDCTMVEETLKETEGRIKKINSCSEAVKQLEKQLEDERKKSVELENLLKSALLDG